MSTASILRVPGINTVDQNFLRTLAAIADRNGWSADGIAGVISHESRFNPAARNPQPGQTATGLIQFIESTARGLGTTTAALARMSATDQLPYVEAFFRKAMPVLPLDPADYLLATYGRGDLVNMPDATNIDCASSPDPKEAQRYQVNSALDSSGTGCITVGDLRASERRVLNAARGARVAIQPYLSTPTNRESPVFLVALAALGMAAAAGYAASLRHGVLSLP